MPRLPTITPQQASRALERAGFYLHHTRGSHYYYKHPHRDGMPVVPHHARDIKRGTLRAIIRQAGMTVEEFLELV